MFSKSVFVDFPFSCFYVQTHHSLIIKNKPKRVQVLTHSCKQIINKTNWRKHFMTCICQINNKIKVRRYVPHKKLVTTLQNNTLIESLILWCVIDLIFWDEFHPIFGWKDIILLIVAGVSTKLGFTGFLLFFPLFPHKIIWEK